MNIFTKNNLDNMNKDYPWNNSINTSKCEGKKQNYVLYATGNATISNGREYIALPADKVLTKEDKRKYNIL